MSSRALQSQFLLLIVVLSAGASIGWLPVANNYPSENLTVTMQGKLVDHTGASVTGGHVNAFPITFNSYPNGHIPAQVEQDGEYTLELLTSIRYVLIYFEYNQSEGSPNSSGTNIRTELVDDEIPDIHTIGVVEANESNSLNVTQLPKAHSVRVRVAAEGKTSQHPANVSVTIFDVPKEDVGGGFTELHVDENGYVQSPPGSNTMELSGNVTVRVNASSLREPVKRDVVIKDNRTINVTVNTGSE